MYNFTKLVGIESPIGIFTWVNQASNGLYGIGIVIATFVISFMVLIQRNRTQDSLASATFVTLMISLVLKTIGLVPWSIVLVLVFGTAGLIAILSPFRR